MHSKCGSGLAREEARTFTAQNSGAPKSPVEMHSKCGSGLAREEAIIFTAQNSGAPKFPDEMRSKCGSGLAREEAITHATRLQETNHARHSQNPDRQPR